LIVRRPDTGLLGGLWDLPGGFCTKRENPRAALIRKLSKDVGLSADTLIHTGTVRHVFTHFRLEITLFTGKAAPAGDRANSAGDRRWIRPADISAYAFPKTAHKLFSLVDFDAGEKAVTKP
jgi:A/G-specific adenine glycosylase